MSKTQGLEASTVEQLLREGVSEGEIGRRFGVSRQAIGQRIDRWGIDRLACKEVANERHRQLVEDALCDVRSGAFTFSGAEKRHGMSVGQLRRYAKRLGLSVEEAVEAGKAVRRGKYNGQRFGCWSVVDDTFTADTACTVTCRCVCGTIRDVHAPNLTNGYSKSCGCMKIPHRMQTLAARGAA